MRASRAIAVAAFGVVFNALPTGATAARVQFSISPGYQAVRIMKAHTFDVCSRNRVRNMWFAPICNPQSVAANVRESLEGDYCVHAIWPGGQTHDGFFTAQLGNALQTVEVKPSVGEPCQ